MQSGRGAGRPPAAAALAALAVCFLLSGMGSLVLEVVWTRSLRLVFGSTTLAVSTILVAYMAGLGLGGLVGGRLARRLRNGVTTYGWIEIAIGLYAAAVPFAMGALPDLVRPFLSDPSFWGGAGLRFGVTVAILIVPTFGMGATLPVLVAAVVRSDRRIGAQIALLYGLNTLGAVAGVLLATFVLFPWLGLGGTNAVGAGIDVAVGVVALTVLARHFAPAAPAPASRPRPPEGRRVRSRPLVPLLAYALVGFTSLVYEVSWTRTLAMVIGSSIYAFASMLASFLTGIALGSLIARSFCDRLRDPALTYAIGIAALGALAMATTLAIPRLPDAFMQGVEWLGTGGSSLVVVHVGVSFLAMLPATLVLGALFPILCRLLARGSEDVGSAVGDVYFANTVGSATGAFAAGFVLIPGLGLRDTLVLAALVNALTAAAVLLSLRSYGLGTRGIAAGGALALGALLFVAPPPWDGAALARGAYREPTISRYTEIELEPIEGVVSDEVLLYRDGLNATVTVHRSYGSVSLRVNGKPDASSFGDMPTQVLSGQIPMLFGPPARDVLVIGYASGVTAGSVAKHPVESIDAVELEPAIIEASHFFDDVNGRPLDDPRVRLIVDDGRNYLQNTERRYDVIISEPSNPWISGVSNLFTVEYFRSVARVLRPGGRLLQWVQLYGMDREGLRSLLAAVRQELPFVSAFAISHGSGDLILMASNEPLRSEYLPRFESLPAGVRADLRRVDIFSTADLWSLLRLAPAEVEALIGSDAVPNSDQNLRIELRAPWTFYQQTLGENWELLAEGTFGAPSALEAAGYTATPDEVAALAYSYMNLRHEPAIFWSLLQLSRSLGPSAHALAIDANIAEQAGHSVAAVLGTLDRGIDAYPDSLDLRLLRWDALTHQRRHSDALPDAQAAARLAPDDPRALERLAASLRDTGQVAESAALMDELLAMPYAGLHPVLWIEATRTYLRAGRGADGLYQLRRFLERDPHSPAEWTLLARVYERLNRTEQAETARRNAATARTNRARVLHRQARVSLNDGDKKAARRLLEESLRADPSYDPARRELAGLPAG